MAPKYLSVPDTSAVSRFRSRPSASVRSRGSSRVSMENPSCCHWQRMSMAKDRGQEAMASVERHHRGAAPGECCSAVGEIIVITTGADPDGRNVVRRKASLLELHGGNGPEIEMIG